jgi:hypothetical protein
VNRLVKHSSKLVALSHLVRNNVSCCCAKVHNPPIMVSHFEDWRVVKVSSLSGASGRPVSHMVRQASALTFLYAILYHQH